MRSLVTTVVGLLLLASPAIAPPLDTFTQKVLAFEKHWGRFVLQLGGCPLDNTKALWVDCKPTLSHLDYKAFAQACKAARELWQLEGPCTTAEAPKARKF
jgi:hypothetical protein